MWDAELMVYQMGTEAQWSCSPTSLCRQQSSDALGVAV